MSEFVDRADIQNLLSLEKVRVESATEMGLLNDGQLVLSWDVPFGLAEECKRWEIDNRIVLTDFEAEFKLYAGNWRTVKCDIVYPSDKHKATIAHTIAKGYYTSADWGSARLSEQSKYSNSNNTNPGITDSASDNPNAFAIVEFPYCAPGSVKDIAESLNSPTYSSPSIRYITLTGTWHNIMSTYRIEEDGSGTAVLFLARPQYTLQAYTDVGGKRESNVYYLWSVPKDKAQGVLDAWRAAHTKGAYATCSYNEASELVDIVLRRKKDETETSSDWGTTQYDCRYSETTTWYFNCTSPTDHPIPSAEVGFNPDTGVTYTRQVRDNEDGTYDIAIIKRTVRYRDIPVFTTSETNENKVEQRQQLGLTSQAIASMAVEPGKIKNQYISVRDDCSKDVITNTDTGKETVKKTVVASRSYVETTEEKTYQSSQLAYPSAVTGHIKRVTNEASRYPGKYNTIESDRVITPIPDSFLYDSSDDHASHSSVAESIGIQNNSGLNVTLDAAAGTSLSAYVRYDKDSDTFDVSKETTTAKELNATSTSGNAFYNETQTNSSNLSAVPSEAPDAGKIVDISFQKNRFDRYDGVKSVRNSVARSTENVVTVNPLFSETSYEFRNSDSVPNQSASAGTIIDQSFSMNEFRKYDIKRSVRTATQIVSSKTKSIDSTDTSGYSTIARNVSILPTVARPNSKSEQRLNFSINEYGLYDYELTEISNESPLSVDDSGAPASSLTYEILEDYIEIEDSEAGESGEYGSTTIKVYSVHRIYYCTTSYINSNSTTFMRYGMSSGEELIGGSGIHYIGNGVWQVHQVKKTIETVDNAVSTTGGSYGDLPVPS